MSAISGSLSPGMARRASTRGTMDTRVTAGFRLTVAGRGGTCGTTDGPAAGGCCGVAGPAVALALVIAVAETEAEVEAEAPPTGAMDDPRVEVRDSPPPPAFRLIPAPIIAPRSTPVLWG